jgi:hypothetical protein
MGAGSADAPKLKRYRVSARDRIMARFHRQRAPRMRRPGALERLRARRASPVGRAPGRPAFRSRNERITAMVAGGLAGFSGLAWYASRLPVPVTEAVELHRSPVPQPTAEEAPASPGPVSSERPGPSPDPGPQNSPLG